MRLHITSLRIIFGITSIPLFFLLTGCHNFYKATPKTVNEIADNYTTQQYNYRFFILRNGGSAYDMSNMILSEDKKFLKCHLDAVAPEHLLHVANGEKGSKRYKLRKHEQSVLNEVHVYIPADSSAKISGDYTLALDKVQKIEVIEKNKGKTTMSYVLGGLGLTVGAFAVVAVIAIATKSSCPFVSAYHDGQMALQGEIYGGAIYPQLARHDYIPLNMTPTPSGMLQLQISNELQENQFTDMAELISVMHDKNIKVMPDESGKLHSISQPILPLKALAANNNVMPLIEKLDDELAYTFNDTSVANEGNNSLVLSFNKPANTAKAKLVLRLKNSYWLDMVYGKFTEGFGSEYGNFIKNQYNTSVEKLNTWKAQQQLPLDVSVLTGNGWQTQQSLTTFGPLAYRETAIPIDISNVQDNKINIKLSTGFMFWEIDYAAIDFSADATMQVTVLQLQKATDETGKNVLPLLSTQDGNYLSQPLPGNAAILEYAYMPVNDHTKTQTYILHAKGYYEHIRNYTNAPDMVFLQQFKQPGALSKLSMAFYKKTINSDMAFLSKQ